MKLRIVCVLVLAGAGAACQTGSQNKVWMPVDPKRAPTNSQFLAAKAQCNAIASQAARAPSTTVMQQTVVVERPRHAGQVDFISENPARRNQYDINDPDPAAFDAAMGGCMAQQGYILTDKPPSR